MEMQLHPDTLSPPLENLGEPVGLPAQLPQQIVTVALTMEHTLWSHTSHGTKQARGGRVLGYKAIGARTRKLRFV